MKIKDIKLGRKLGDNFLNLIPELKNAENNFNKFQSNFSERITDLLDFEDTTKGIAQLNTAVQLYWDNALAYKASIEIISNLMRAFLVEKLDVHDESEMEFKNSVESWLLHKSSFADFSIMLECVHQYTQLEGYYYLAWFADLSPHEMDIFNSHRAQLNIEEDEITMLEVKTFAKPSQRVEIAQVMLEHYLSLFNRSVESFKKNSLFTKIDSSLFGFEEWIKVLVIESGKSLQLSIEPKLLETLKKLTDFSESDESFF
jgi:hypothetical protein